MDKNRRVGDRRIRRGKDWYGVGQCKDEDDESGAGEVKLSDNTWGDKDRALTCRRCQVRGLRYGGKTGFCGTCWSALPGIIKATNRNFKLDAVVERYKTSMVTQFGIAKAAELLGVDPAELDPARFHLSVVMARYKASMVERFGVKDAAKMLAVDPAELDPTKYKS